MCKVGIYLLYVPFKQRNSQGYNVGLTHNTAILAMCIIQLSLRQLYGSE